MIDLTNEADISILTMKHGKANALDLELLEEMTECLDELEEKKRTVILTGKEGIFSAGVDLHRFVNGSENYIDQFLPALAKLMGRLFFYPNPLVTAVNGHAIAGGCILMCCGDHRIVAGEKTLVGVPELSVGLSFPPLVLEILKSCVQNSMIDRVLFGGKNYGGDEITQLGFAHERTSPDDLMSKAMKIASAYSKLPSEAYALNKAQLRHSTQQYLKDFGVRQDAAVLRQWKSEQAQDSVRSFIEKTFGKKS